MAKGVVEAAPSGQPIYAKLEIGIEEMPRQLGGSREATHHQPPTWVLGLPAVPGAVCPNAGIIKPPERIVIPTLYLVIVAVTVPTHETLVDIWLRALPRIQTIIGISHDD